MDKALKGYVVYTLTRLAYLCFYLVKKVYNGELASFGNCFVFNVVCRSKVDLAFVIDGSGSIEYYGKGNFRRCLRFVEMVVRQFNSGQTRVGLIVYSSRPRVYSDFRYRSKRSILSIIRRIRYPRGGTRTGYALKYCYRRLFRKTRRGVRKVYFGCILYYFLNNFVETLAPRILPTPILTAFC